MCQIKDNETQKDCRYNSYTESSRVLQQRPIKGGSTSSLAAQPPQLLLLLFAFVIRFCRLSLRSLSLSPPFPRMDRRSHNVRIYCCCCCCWYVKGKIYMCTHVCVCSIHTYIIFVAVTLLVTLTLTYTHVHLRHTTPPYARLSSYLYLTHSTPFRPTPAAFFAVAATIVFVFVSVFGFGFLPLLVLRGLGLGVAVL